jgi:hypothetical protein
VVPGTVLCTSPELRLDTGFNMAEVSQFSVLVPDTFTWTVTFQGIDVHAGEVAGLRVYDSPTIGSTFADSWAKNSLGYWNTYHLEDGHRRPSRLAL